MQKVKSQIKYKLSPSSIHLLEECPRCFWLQITKKVKRPSGAFPSLPSGVDKLLKEHFDRYRAKGQIPPELKHHKVEAKLFSDEELLNAWRNNFKGIPVLDKKSGILLRGAVDELLQKGSKIIVMDFKTRGFALKEDTALHYHDQLHIYNYLLRKNGYDTEDYSYLLFFMPKLINSSGDFVFETELVKVDVNIERAEHLFHKAIQVLQGEMPDASDKCGYCKWRLN